MLHKLYHVEESSDCGFMEHAEHITFYVLELVTIKQLTYWILLQYNCIHFRASEEVVVVCTDTNRFSTVTVKHIGVITCNLCVCVCVYICLREREERRGERETMPSLLAYLSTFDVGNERI